MMASIALRLAVCLFPGVCALDYQGPIELLGFLSPDSPSRLPATPKFQLKITYIAPEKTVKEGGIQPWSGHGPKIVADTTYESAIEDKDQFDILLVPGGPGARPQAVPQILIIFIQNQLPSIRANPNGYILSVCTGSWILAMAGVLDGKKATTNKSAFNECKAATSNSIDWIAKARWVEDDDKHLWTSSGVTAGMDMAAAFLMHLCGDEVTRYARGIIELGVRDKGDDEFAEYYGLI